jgi:predicted O-linked N-acetylglucosamine transferase (SPINDLY family)
VNYLGYAGTSGAHFYDALIADEIVIPLDQQAHYSEPVAYLANSFFPVDTTISVDSLGDLPTRSSQGLPKHGFIFACFNNAYKITPPIFDLWMHLLKEVPDSILWLSKPSPRAILNLQKEAKARDIDESRLIFATRTPGRHEHLSRLRLADLFLDTPNYNAHATAADALWAGLPLLTQIGNTFSGRVAASLLNALNLNDLIAASESEYVAKALEIAKSPEKLKSIRRQLEINRTHSPLFNTKQYVEDLESLYTNLVNKANLQ